MEAGLTSSRATHLSFCGQAGHFEAKLVRAPRTAIARLIVRQASWDFTRPDFTARHRRQIGSHRTEAESRWRQMTVLFRRLLKFQ